MGAELVSRPFFVKRAGSLFVGGVFLVFLQSIFLSLRQYEIWKSGPLAQFLLPPHQTGYFFSYIGYKIFTPWLLSLLAAVLVARAAEYWNRRSGDRFFEQEEIWFIRFGFFLTGYPGFLLYAVVILVAGVFYSSLCVISSRGRAPLYYLWLPAALLSLLIKGFFIPQAVLGIFVL